MLLPLCAPREGPHPWTYEVKNWKVHLLRPLEKLQGLQVKPSELLLGSLQSIPMQAQGVIKAVEKKKKET